MFNSFHFRYKEDILPGFHLCESVKEEEREKAAIKNVGGSYLLIKKYVFSKRNEWKQKSVPAQEILVGKERFSTKYVCEKNGFNINEKFPVNFHQAIQANALERTSHVASCFGFDEENKKLVMNRQSMISIDSALFNQPSMLFIA